MAFNINEIKSNLQFGGARPTLFKVIVTPPAGILEISGDLARFEFMATATAIPASDVGLIQVPYFGRKYKIAGDRQFAPWSVNVMNDEDFAIRDAMERWNYKINSYEGNKNLAGASPLDYKAVADVIQYSKEGTPVRIYSFNGIYPESVSQIGLDWNSNDTIEEFSVTFQYDYFEVNGGTTGLLNRFAVTEADVA